MCMIDGSDDRVNLLAEDWRTARKDHKCGECARVIPKGELYLVERWVYDGSATTHKTCRHCHRVRAWLGNECGGWIYGSVREDILEHVHEGYYGVSVKMMAIGMQRKWQREDGRMWPLPSGR